MEIQSNKQNLETIRIYTPSDDEELDRVSDGRAPCTNTDPARVLPGMTSPHVVVYFGVDGMRGGTMPLAIC